MRARSPRVHRTSERHDASGLLVATAEWWPDTTGGMGRVATGLTHALAALGYPTTVIAPTSPGMPAHEQIGLVALDRALPRRFVPATIGDPILGERAGRRHRQDGAVLIGHGPAAALGVSHGAASMPLVLTFHAPAQLELEIESGSSELPASRRARAHVLSRITGEIERRAVARAHTIVVLSDFTSRLLESLYDVAGRVHRIPAGVDIKRFSPADDRAAVRSETGIARESVLLFTARRLQPRMGLTNLVRALALLADLPHVELAIAGRGPLEGTLQKLVADLQLGHRVRLLGHVSDDELISWYQAADLVVVPTVELEGFGMVTVEALACGTPVLGTSEGATPELLDPLNRRLVAASDEPVALAARIRDTLSVLGDSLRTRCRAHASERYSWTVVAQEWSELLAGIPLRPGQSLRGAAE